MDSSRRKTALLPFLVFCKVVLLIRRQSNLLGKLTSGRLLVVGRDPCLEHTFLGFHCNLLAVFGRSCLAVLFDHNFIY